MNSCNNTRGVSNAHHFYSGFLRIAVLIAVANVFCVLRIKAQTPLSVDIDVGGTSPSGFSVWNLNSLSSGSGLALVTTNFGSVNLALSASSTANAGNAPAVDGSGNLTSWGNNIISRARTAIANSGSFTYGGLY